MFQVADLAEPLWGPEALGDHLPHNVTRGRGDGRLGVSLIAS